MIAIDDLIEIWARVHKEATPARDSDLSWWREACAWLRPPLEDNEILNEETN